MLRENNRTVLTREEDNISWRKRHFVFIEENFFPVGNDCFTTFRALLRKRRENDERCCLRHGGEGTVS